MKWVFAAVLGLATAAVADDQSEATKLFEEGRKLSTQGRVDEACEKFTKSYELEQAAGTALNLAECAERAGNWKHAFELYSGAAETFAKKDQAARAKFARERAASVKRLHPEVEPPPPEPPVPDVRPAEQPAQPQNGEKTSSQTTKRTIAKIAAVGFLGISGIGGVWWAYSWSQMQEFGAASGFTIASGTPKNPDRVDAPDCGNVTLSPQSAQDKFTRACDAYDRLRWLQPATLVSLGLGVGAVVYLIVTRPKQKPVAIVPTATGDAAFVTAAFEF